ncbi:polymorphic toxin-type HINT domain-containing protein [Actinoplanes sp. NPDC020271]|uniref:polymorphic toxin-type HINT domain-containing protein n=1 Tax=Actinoplanes sp. NPDC020271 TaxID=3363896 RepID=UPI00379BD5EA
MLSINGPKIRLMPRWRRLAVAALVVTLAPALMNLVAGEPALAAPKIPEPAKLERVTLGKSKVTSKAKIRRVTAPFNPSARTALPEATATTVTLPAATANNSAPAAVRAGSSPIAVGRPANGAGPDRVQVKTADQKTTEAAGIHGVLFTLAATSGAGEVQVNVDPSTFANAYGGGYASRLHLVQMPACALSTPQQEKCRTRTPVTTTAVSPLSAQVSLTAATSGAMVLAATSDTAGAGGDYAATSLSPGGTWSTSGNTGAFTYSYPIKVPPAIGGAAPDTDLSYNSAGQDARTMGTNSQSSWVGDGWSMSENYVERTYQTCEDVKDSGAPKYSGDLCWAGQILTLSLGGASTSIVYDDKFHTFRPQTDDATTQIDNLFDATNGTKNGEYFRVTKNGTQYYFGLNRLPGWTAGNEETQSVQTVPVYKSHADNSACPDGSFADTACTLGYRFNLDYVVDRNNNAIAYYYNDPEIGYYGPNMKDTAVSYIRATTLKRIDYGMTASTIFSATAPEQIVFTTDERCLAGQPAGNTCADSQFTASNPEYWPDVPVDLNCTKGKDCTIHGPSFWSRVMLTKIVTQAKVGGVIKQIDQYDLTHSFPDNADHSPTPWLQSITRKGLDRLGGASADQPAGTVSFEPMQLANRVGILPGPKMYYNRIGTVWSETGAETVIDYNTPTCTGLPPANPSSDPDANKAAQKFASTNTTGCFPVYWTPTYQPEPLLDWFYTHPVKSVTTYDSAGNHYQDGTQPKLITEYKYLGDPGWHYDDNEVVKPKNRTWGQFRGYPEVDVTTGIPAVFHYTDGQKVFDRRTLTKTYYFRGMDADTLPGDGVRVVPDLQSTDGSVTISDDDQYAGKVFETVTYTSADSDATIDNATVTVPTLIGPTASRIRDGMSALQAYVQGTSQTLHRQKVSYGWRRTEKDTFYNKALGQSTTGMPVQSVDRGETGAAANVATCTFTRYLSSSVPLAAGKTAPLVLPAEVIGTAQDCNTADAKPSGTLLSDTRTSYDDLGFGYDGQSSPPQPTRGNPTLTQTAAAATGVTVDRFIDAHKTTYDSYGRTTSTIQTPNAKAADGTTSLARAVYVKTSPASGALPTTVTTIKQVTAGVSCSAVTKSSKDCQLSTVTMDPVRQLAVATTDVAGLLTSTTYDALGRITAVWRPNKTKAAGAPPNITHTYQVSKNGPSVVTTRTLLDSDSADTTPVYAVTKALYDAMLRPLETQQTGENGSTIVSDTQYDSHGWTVITNDSYAVSGDPVDTLISDHLSQVSIPATTVTDHDAMGRTTQSTAEHNGTKTWYTRTAYTGDKVTTIPPTGAVATTSTTDARGRLVELTQHTTAPTLNGNLTDGFTATGGTGNSVAYTYTSAGQSATITGPDKAVWSDAYDLLGRKISHTDPDAGTSYSSYDDAGNLALTKDARGNQLTYTYDLLGRKLTAVDKSASNFKYASWTYDTLRIGLPTSSTRYVSGVTGGYTVAVTGYSVLGNPLGQTLTLPSIEQPLPAAYTTKFTYTPNTELPATQEDPAVGTLPGEKITYNHDALGAAMSTSGIDLYVAATIHTDFGQPSKLTMGDSTNHVDALYSYDEQTLRPASQSIYRSHGVGPQIDQTTFTYDDAGNPLSTVNQQSESGSVVTDAQCYRYDSLDRLVDAWTAASACPKPDIAKPATDEVANGAGSYWQSFSYSANGNREQLVEHATTGGADTTTTYANGCMTTCATNGTQPHTLTQVKGNADPTTLVYDASGNLLTRTASSGNNQSLAWNHEGQLSQVTTSGTQAGTTKYLYDADGNQLIRRDPGRTSLFIGDTEIVVDTSTSTPALLGAVRTYNHGGATVAIRSTLPNGGTHYLFGTANGTASMSIDTTTLQVARHQYKPYGEERSNANTTAWPDMTRGYLHAPKDTSTGYTDVGARKYDPTFGHFISVDPILDPANPQQWNGYSYANNNPITLSDPSGLEPRPWHNPDYDPADCANSTSQECHPAGKIDYPTNYNPGTGTYQPDEVMAYADTNKDHRISRPEMAKYDLDYDHRKDNTCHDSAGKCVLKGAASLAIILVGGVVLIGGTIVCLDMGIVGCATVAGEAAIESAAPGTVVAGGAATTKLGLEALEDAESGAASGAAKAAKTSCDSFDPNTLVVLADGSTKPISEIEVGDLVVATDPSTNETANKPVTELHDNLDVDLANLKVTDGQGHTSVIRTTRNHRFWDATTDQWTTVADLQRGDRLTALDGADVRVEAVTLFTKPRHMLNLTVADIHSYYVLAGKTPVLVHNVTVPCPRVGLADAASNASTGSGKMNGVLYADMDDAPYYVSSGYKNLDPGYVVPPGAMSGFEHHLEAQAAARMRATGSKRGTLFITGDYICGSCHSSLEQMLPSGSTLTITYRDSGGVLQSVPYTGR